MRKGDLLAALDDAMKEEEGATSVYLKRLSEITTQSGLNRDDLDLIRNRIDFLAAMNRSHRDLIAGIIAKVRAMDSDVV